MRMILFDDSFFSWIMMGGTTLVVAMIVVVLVVVPFVWCLKKKIGVALHLALAHQLSSVSTVGSNFLHTYTYTYSS